MAKKNSSMQVQYMRICLCKAKKLQSLTLDERVHFTRASRLVSLDFFSFYFVCHFFEKNKAKTIFCLLWFFSLPNEKNSFLLCAIKTRWLVHLCDHNFWNLLNWIVFRSLVSATNSNRIFRPARQRALPKWQTHIQVAKTRKSGTTVSKISNWFKVGDQLTNTL